MYRRISPNMLYVTIHIRGQVCDLEPTGYGGMDLLVSLTVVASS